MPLRVNKVFSLWTISLRSVARNMELHWKKEWDPELVKITKVSDEILLDLRKNVIALILTCTMHFLNYLIVQ